MSNQADEELLQIEALGKEGTHNALYQFALSLTLRAEELELKERNHEIMPEEATEILHMMVQSFVFAAIRTGVNQEYNRHDATPNHLVEQQCLEARIEVIERLEQLKKPRPESGPNRNGNSEGVRKAYNRGVSDAIAVLKAQNKEEK